MNVHISFSPAISIFSFRYGVEIHDFGKSWRSGLAFLALVKFFCPQFVDMRKALSSEPRLNMETAFTAANEWLGIPPLLDPDGNTQTNRLIFFEELLCIVCAF